MVNQKEQLLLNLMKLEMPKKHATLTEEKWEAPEEDLELTELEANPLPDEEHQVETIYN